MAIFDYKELLRQKLCEKRSENYSINTKLSSYPVVSEYINTSGDDHYLVFNTSNNYIVKISEEKGIDEEELLR